MTSRIVGNDNKCESGSSCEETRAILKQAENEELAPANVIDQFHIVSQELQSDRVLETQQGYAIQLASAPAKQSKQTDNLNPNSILDVTQILPDSEFVAVMKRVMAESIVLSKTLRKIHKFPDFENELDLHFSEPLPQDFSDQKRTKDMEKKHKKT